MSISKVYLGAFLRLHASLPRYRQAKRVLGKGKNFLEEKIPPCISWMASTYQEIYWDDRWTQWNHCPSFPLHVTGKFYWKETNIVLRCN